MNVAQLKRVLDTVDDDATIEIDGGLLMGIHSSNLILEGVTADPHKNKVVVYVESIWT